MKDSLKDFGKTRTWTCFTFSMISIFLVLRSIWKLSSIRATLLVALSPRSPPSLPSQGHPRPSNSPVPQEGGQLQRLFRIYIFFFLPFLILCVLSFFRLFTCPLVKPFNIGCLFENPRSLFLWWNEVPIIMLLLEYKGETMFYIAKRNIFTPENRLFFPMVYAVHNFKCLQ